MTDFARSQLPPLSPVSCWADIDGPVHYVDHGGIDDGPLLVCVHGLGGSLATWAAAGPALARTGRVLALDLAGFGHTRDPRLSATVPANRNLLHRFLTTVAGTPAILIGHSMGGTIAAMQASQYPDTVAGLVLISPTVPWVQDQISKKLNDTRVTLGRVVGAEDRAPGLPAPAPEVPIRRTLWLGFEQAFLGPRRIIHEYASFAREQRKNNNTNTEYFTAARSLVRTLVRRWEFAEMLAGIASPVLWLHGDKDPVVPIDAARVVSSRNPAWQLQIARDVGHAPHLEAPEWTAERIAAWLNSAGSAAAERARAARGPWQELRHPEAAESR